MSIHLQTGELDIGADGPTTDTGNPTGFTQVQFPQTFSARPIVMAMVQSFNGPDTPGLRIRNVTTTGFEIRMNELVLDGTAQSPGSGHNQETIAWMAVET